MKNDLFGLAENRTDVWATPQDFFDKLNAVFNFNLDVCALSENAKCERFFSPEQNGLKQEWTGTCWMNPPYGREIHFIRGRLKFGGSKSNAPFGCCVVVFRPSLNDVQWSDA